MHIARRLPLIALILALSPFSLSPASVRAESYPQETLNNFTRTCINSCMQKIQTSGKSPQSCTQGCPCVAKALPSKISYAEFMAFETSLKNRQQPSPTTTQKFQSLINQCAATSTGSGAHRPAPTHR